MNDNSAADTLLMANMQTRNSGGERKLFVFIPGLCQTEAHFRPVTEALKNRGHDAIIIPLSSTSLSRHARLNMDNDVRAITAELEHRIWLQDMEVVLVCHDYGAVPACQAINGLDRPTTKTTHEVKNGGITHLVFQSAFLIPEGKSVAGVVGTMPWVDQDSVSCAVLPSNEYTEYCFNDMNEAQQQSWSAWLSDTIADLTQSVKGTCWNVGLPKTYIMPTKDKTGDVVDYKGMLSELDDGTWSHREMVGAGHCPFLSRPEEYAGLLVSVVGGEQGKKEEEPTEEPAEKPVEEHTSFFQRLFSMCFAHR